MRNDDDDDDGDGGGGGGGDDGDDHVDVAAIPPIIVFLRLPWKKGPAFQSSHLRQAKKQAIANSMVVVVPFRTTPFGSQVA